MTLQSREAAGESSDLGRIHNLRTLATWMAGGVAIAVALVIPTLYLLTAYHYESSRMESEASRVADRISAFAYSNPILWKFSEHTLVALARSQMGRSGGGLNQLFDEDGELLAETGHSPSAPILVRSAEISDGQHVAGSVKIIESLQPIMFATGWVALFSFSLSITVFIVLRTLPLRALSAALNRLDHSQEALRKSHELLERRVTERTAELTATNKQLQAEIIERKKAEQIVRENEKHLRNLQAELSNVSRLSAMGQLSTALAHELNQPLAAIMNYVQACRRVMKTAGGSASDKIYEMMDKALDQADRAGAIISGLREIIEKGETAPSEEDLNQIVEEASALALIGAPEKGIEVNLDLGARLPSVLVNKIQIQQVLLNLVRNSIEAMVASEKRELTVKTELEPGNAVEVAVYDRGPGLSKDVEKRLYQPFVTTKAEGMGLGLSISKSIIEAHGGRLWATPNSGGGTIFRFTLPIMPEADKDYDE